MGSAVLFYTGVDEYYNYHQSHFLEACTLCQKPIGKNSDIYMYRGDTPFCSQECRQEQIEVDEANEKSWKRSSSSSKKTLRKKSNDSTNNQSTPNKPVRMDTVAVS